ncbi:3-phenylpropionate/cinnamic acid dioxygenase small subunit [Arthrobacter sp. SLBN-100]|uniref:aromatic-ring-hydroxylating dioxygenase subunit beta n=1 Tax=Arthrobacter sp. SLBN-100 TaxID=2768450 RepID=UPI0011527017|nr:aromatic-ring-hydroxylating dioxygenase subunit beta [Arthrobacter sp. SLBN-100]TQJ62156.1 3-phenylpropionate/cinnamic acid dioxygenase small subunit [Arthrobacter sp. SLBN-100]
MNIETVENSTDLHKEFSCAQFLFLEAELLDNNDYSGWFERCISTDIEYVIPIRLTRQRGVSEFSTNGFHVNDRYRGIKLRVDRMRTEHAWAEDPPSRTKRFVTNIRVAEIDGNEVTVKSNLLVHRSQWDTHKYDLLAAGREDRLRLESGQWRLVQRTVYLNHTILPTANLGIIL